MKNPLDMTGSRVLVTGSFFGHRSGDGNTVGGIGLPGRSLRGTRNACKQPVRR